jgi:glucose-1-phosphate thymidylyltransferase
LLAGGRGTRLYPLTATVSKQLVAVFNKPMVYYPLTTMMLAGIREILVISTPDDLDRFRGLLGSGADWGIRIEYAEQAEANGIAEAVLIGEDFVEDNPMMLMLGDNVIYGRLDFLRSAVDQPGDHATVFAYQVEDPSQYGVVEFDDDGSVLSLEEKPEHPKSRWAVPGIYLYPPGVADVARTIEPSPRGELEITDLNRRFLDMGRLHARRMGRGIAWFDTGTSRELLEAANFMEALERRQGLIIGSPEEAAYRMGYIDLAHFTAAIDQLPACQYRDYLARVAEEDA